MSTLKCMATTKPLQEEQEPAGVPGKGGEVRRREERAREPHGGLERADGASALRSPVVADGRGEGRAVEEGGAVGGDEGREADKSKGSSRLPLSFRLHAAVCLRRRRRRRIRQPRIQSTP